VVFRHVILLWWLPPVLLRYRLTGKLPA
jgi:hypothetical protein